MNPASPQPIPDPARWPVVECEPADVFLGTFVYNCATATEEPPERPATEPGRPEGPAGNPAPVR